MGKWEMPNALLARSCGHVWGNFIPGGGCMLWQQNPRKSDQSHSPGWHWNCVHAKRQGERAQWNVKDRGLQTPWTLCDLPITDPLTEDRNLTFKVVQYDLYSIAGWLARHVANYRGTPWESRLKTSLKKWAETSMVTNHNKKGDFTVLVSMLPNKETMSKQKK